MAGPAGLVDHAARSFAARAGLLNLENAPRRDHLAAPAAGVAGVEVGALLRAAAGAGLAGIQFGNADLLLAAVRRLVEGDLQIVTQIRAAQRAGGIRPTARAKEIVENAAAALLAEDLAKDLKGIVKVVAAPGGPTARVKRAVAVLIVGGALLRIAQGLVGFAEFLELFLGGLVARVFVRVMLHRELAVGLLDFILARATRDAEHLVVISFGHRGQAAGFLATMTAAGRSRRSRSL